MASKSPSRAFADEEYARRLRRTLEEFKPDTLQEISQVLLNKQTPGTDLYDPIQKLLRVREECLFRTPVRLLPESKTSEGDQVSLSPSKSTVAMK